jgi:TPR repeat protein
LITEHIPVAGHDVAIGGKPGSSLHTQISATDSTKTSTFKLDSITTSTFHSPGLHADYHYAVDADHLESKLYDHMALTGEMDEMTATQSRIRALHQAASDKKGRLGNPDAQYELVPIYEQAARTSRTASKQSEYRQQAADFLVKAYLQEHIQATRHIAFYKQHGLGGYSRNISDALALERKARKLDNAGVPEHVARLEHNRKKPTRRRLPQEPSFLTTVASYCPIQ